MTDTPFENPFIEDIDIDWSQRYHRIARVVFKYQDEYLLLKRVNKWEIPGGGIEPNETEQEGALREAVHETGIEIDEIKLNDDPLVLQRKRKHKHQDQIITIFVVNLEKRPQIDFSEEHKDMKWVKKDKIFEENLRNQTKEILEKLFKSKKALF